MEIGDCVIRIFYSYFMHMLSVKCFAPINFIILDCCFWGFVFVSLKIECSMLYNTLTIENCNSWHQFGDKVWNSVAAICMLYTLIGWASKVHSIRPTVNEGYLKQEAESECQRSDKPLWKTKYLPLPSSRRLRTTESNQIHSRFESINSIIFNKNLAKLKFSPIAN